MKHKAINRDLKPTREGDVILIVVPNYWAKGATVTEAIQNVRKAGGKTSGQYRVYSSHPDAYIDGMGMAFAPHASELLQESA
jgi:hypothetical protein